MRFKNFLLTVLLACSGPVAAQNPIAAEWDGKMASSTKALRSGDYGRALKLSTAVAKDMVESLGPGDDATRAFGIVLTHRALALAGLGREEEADRDPTSASRVQPPRQLSRARCTRGYSQMALRASVAARARH